MGELKAGVAVSAKEIVGVGLGLGLGEGETSGLGDAAPLGLGEGESEGAGLASGEGEGDASGDGDGLGAGDASGLGDAVSLGLGAGLASGAGDASGLGAAEADASGDGAGDELGAGGGLADGSAASAATGASSDTTSRVACRNASARMTRSTRRCPDMLDLPHEMRRPVAQERSAGREESAARSGIRKEISAGAWNSSTRSTVGTGGATAIQLSSAEKPHFGTQMVPTVHRASSTHGDFRCLEAPPPIHLSPLHGRGAHQAAQDSCLPVKGTRRRRVAAGRGQPATAFDAILGLEEPNPVPAKDRWRGNNR